MCNGKQRYKCGACGKRFIGGERLNNEVLWQDYVEGKQTYIQLACKHACSSKTIQRRLDKARTRVTSSIPKEVIVLMDTTYFGRKFGVMLFKNALSGESLYKTYVKTETNQLYGRVFSTLSKKALLSVPSCVMDAGDYSNSFHPCPYGCVTFTR